MADDKIKQDNRGRVATAEDYEVSYLAEKAGISHNQAKALIQKHGNDRRILMREAKKLNGSG